MGVRIFGIRGRSPWKHFLPTAVLYLVVVAGPGCMATGMKNLSTDEKKGASSEDPMAVRAITFDYWGTLFRDTGSDERQQMRLEAFVKATGANPEEAAAAMRLTFQEFQRSHIEDQRTLTPMDAVRLTCDTLRVSVGPREAELVAEVFATAILKYPPVPIEGALEAVAAAAQRVPIGLISDTGVSPGSSLRQIMDVEGFTGYFGTLTFSDEVGVAKPQAPMFEQTARILNVTPSELLHIGDLQPTDILGVQQLGGQGALFAGVNTRFVGKTTAEYTFAHWQEFIRLIPELC